VNFLHFALLLSVITVWGFNYVAVKTSLESIPPIFLCFLRFLFCIPAIFFVEKPKAFRQIAIYSLVMFVLQFSVLFCGMQLGITAGLASVLVQFQSFFAIALGAIFLKEKCHVRQWIGGIVALPGIFLIAANTSGEGIAMSGLFLVLVAAIIWAIGSLLAKRLTESSGLSLVAWASLFATPPLLILSLLVEGSDAIQDCLQTLSWLPLSAVSFTAFMATLFGFGIWNWLLRLYPLSYVSFFTLFIPIVGMLSSSLLLREPMHWWKLTAAGFILAGLSIHLFISFLEKERKQKA
jgi:O-acetylserine/cysteine efflux transporter